MVEAVAPPQRPFHDEEALSSLMQTLQSPADRRTNPRYECQYTVEFDGQRVRGICTDISLSGMRVRLSGEGFVSDLNDLKCWLWIQGGLIRLNGRIVRVTRSREVAIRFSLPANAVGRMRLNQYVAGNPRADEASEFRKVVAFEERRPQRAARHVYKKETSFLVIDEEAMPRLAARQADKKRQEDAARARAVAEGTEAEKAREAGDEADASPGEAKGFVSTMSRNRGVSLMKFWIDRRATHHHG